MLLKTFIAAVLSLFALTSLPITAQADVKSRAQTLQFLKENNIQSVIQYASWLQKNMHYKHDKDRDTWAKPEETIRDRVGDCEDFAFLSAEVLRIFGFTPRIIAVGREKEAHVICIFKLNNVYFAFDNTALNDTHQQTMDSMVRFLGKRQNAQFILELSLEPEKQIRPIYLFDSTGRPRQVI